MRRSSFVLFITVLLTSVSLPLTLQAQEKQAEQKPTTMAITGTLVDLACYAKAGVTTNDHGDMKNCGSSCVQGGLPVGLLDADKKVHFLGVPASAYAEYVGKELRLTGMQGKYAAEVFIPEKLEVKEGDKWVEKKLPKTMM
jgi:hypothetical protein